MQWCTGSALGNWCCTPVHIKLAMLATLWEDCPHLGIRAVRGEKSVGTAEGVWRARSVQRRSLGEGWRSQAEGLVGGLPWHTSAGDPEAEGPPVLAELSEWMSAQEMPETAEAVREAVPRRALITRQEWERCGLMAGCPRCRRCCRPSRIQDSRGLQDVDKAHTRKGPPCVLVRHRENTCLEKLLEKEDRKRRLAEGGRAIPLPCRCRVNRSGPKGVSDPPPGRNIDAR